VNFSENPLSDKILGNIRDCAEDAATLIQVAPTQSPSEIVEAVDSFVYRWQKGVRPKVDEEDDLSLTLGSLWGEQIVREFKWQWGSVTFHNHGDSKAVAVLSPDRSLAIYPFHFVYGCMEKGASVTIMLAYNMLKNSNKIPPLPARGYENLMENVHHIIPRE